MIQFADEITRPQVRQMWKSVFGDPDPDVELYFRHKYRDKDTLLFMEGEVVAASLQMLSYTFTFCGREIPIIYLSGVATLPEYRKRGYVRQLLERSFEEAALREVPLVLLVPQESWLLKFYERYGFEQTFDAGVEVLPSLKTLTEQFPNDLHAAFREFNFLFRQQEMTVQKSYDDFCVMVEEAALSGYPAKRNLIGMARVIDAYKLLSLFAQRYPQKSFSITVEDSLLDMNNNMFTLGKGEVVRGVIRVKPEVEVGVGQLAQLLLGYHAHEMDAPLNILFPEKKPQMHYMLE